VGHALPPHPATLSRARAAQPRLATLHPHPATVSRAGAVHGAVQRSARELDTKLLESKITRYGAANMAGACVTSATEVGKVLAEVHGSASVSYFVTVYRDERNEVRNHIAAAVRVGAVDQIVDATWKQFPYLYGLQRGELGGASWKQQPLIGTFSRDEWQATIAHYTPGIRDVTIAQLATAEEAQRWMRDQRRERPSSAPAPGFAAGKSKSPGCTLF
jgi:hypothetical protein